jgi:hypothetical protein
MAGDMEEHRRGKADRADAVHDTVVPLDQGPIVFRATIPFGVIPVVAAIPSRLL